MPQLATVDLSGRAVQTVVSRGKHLLVRIEGGVTLHTHYKMDGDWHLYRHGETWRGPAFQVRAVLENSDFVAVGFRLADVDLVDSAAEHEIVGHLGSDPLGDDWDPIAVAAAMRSRSDEEIGSILLDQRVMAGPGNVYKSEVCFLAGVDPRTLVRDIPDLSHLIHLTERLMKANRTTGNQITTGDLRPGRRRWVYGRSGRGCLRCGTPIEKTDQPGYGGERVTYRCPTCQPAARSTTTGAGRQVAERKG